MAACGVVLPAVPDRFQPHFWLLDGRKTSRFFCAFGGVFLGAFSGAAFLQYLYKTVKNIVKIAFLSEFPCGKPNRKTPKMWKNSAHSLKNVDNYPKMA